MKRTFCGFEVFKNLAKYPQAQIDTFFALKRKKEENKLTFTVAKSISLIIIFFYSVLN